MKPSIAVSLVFSAACALVPCTGQAAEFVRVAAAADSLAAQPLVACDTLEMSVTLPSGRVVSGRFRCAETAELSLAGGGDGQYVYEVGLAPRLGAAERAALLAAREAGAAPATPRLVESGGFRVLHGALVPPRDEARQGGAPGANRPAPPAPDDFVVNDDLIVEGAACLSAGLNCADGEFFGNEDLKLKSVLPYLKLEDTSGAGFPATDWMIEAGDGIDRFVIHNLDLDRKPFGVLAGAPDDSILVTNLGRVGFRTSNPLKDLHLKTSSTPTLRLEQDALGGFPARTWDIAADDTGFAIADVTASVLPPFSIRPGAPRDSLVVGTTGVGVGTFSPAAPLHVRRTDGNTRVVVEETNATVIGRNLLRLANNGPATFRFDNSSNGTTWGFGQIVAGNNFFISAGGVPSLSLTLEPGGNLVISGVLTQNSDRAAKDDVEPVDGPALLARIGALPLSFWHYKDDDRDVRHVGPMAQDFTAAFRVGADERHIAPGDMAGVALAGIQALHAQNQRLRDENSRLAERLSVLEAVVERLVADAALHE